MYLKIEGNFTTQFVTNLIEKMKQWFWMNVDLSRMELIEKYFTLLYPIDREPITSREICEFALDNLITKTDMGMVLIMFNENVRLKNYPIKLIDALNLINFGNRELAPYPIFSEMFEEVAGKFELYEIMVQVM